MKKTVNGVEVEMTQAEIDEHNDRQLSWEKSKKEIEYKKYKSILKDKISSECIKKGYENEFECVSFKGSSNVKWAREAKNFFKWRDDCWEYLESIKNESDTNSDYTYPSVENFIKSIPEIEWEAL